MEFLFSLSTAQISPYLLLSFACFPIFKYISQKLVSSRRFYKKSQMMLLDFMTRYIKYQAQFTHFKCSLYMITRKSHLTTCYNCIPLQFSWYKKINTNTMKLDSIVERGDQFQIFKTYMKPWKCTSCILHKTCILTNHNKFGLKEKSATFEYRLLTNQ